MTPSGFLFLVAAPKRQPQDASMPSDSISQALKESYSQANAADVYLDTLVVNSRVPGYGIGTTPNLDIAFIVDNSGSMGSLIAEVKLLIEDLTDALTEEYGIVRFGLTTFKDEDETQIVTHLTTDTEAFIADINALSVSGGGDIDENGFGATKMTADDMEWSDGTPRLVFLLTDAPSHERGATESETLDALDAKDIPFMYGSPAGQTWNYGDLIDDTGGDVVEFDQLTEEILQRILQVIGQIIPPPVPEARIVNAPVSYDLALEAGGPLVEFQPVGFSIALPGQNDQGIQSMNISIDNVSKEISDIVQKLADNGHQMALEYRTYLASDPTTPQNDPPLTLVLSDVKTTQHTVTGSATFIDIVNMQFLTKKYTRDRFPSLGN